MSITGWLITYLYIHMFISLFIIDWYCIISTWVYTIYLLVSFSYQWNNCVKQLFYHFSRHRCESLNIGSSKWFKRPFISGYDQFSLSGVYRVDSKQFLRKKRNNHNYHWFQLVSGKSLWALGWHAVTRTFQLVGFLFRTRSDLLEGVRWERKPKFIRRVPWNLLFLLYSNPAFKHFVIKLLVNLFLRYPPFQHLCSWYKAFVFAEVLWCARWQDEDAWCMM